MATIIYDCSYCHKGHLNTTTFKKCCICNKQFCTDCVKTCLHGCAQNHVNGGKDITLFICKDCPTLFKVPV